MSDKLSTTGPRTRQIVKAGSARLGSQLTAMRAAAARRLLRAVTGDAGMSTVEYAVGTVAAAAFGAVLYTVVSGDSIPDALGAIIERALSSSV